ncbi:GAF domain-containing sensor histidine kinase [Halotia branconii]|uniref:histidine kinase n=1 Tax=Halotia branconii CENA392 TaxID=1539056 RepID=A0AAJ6P7S3_9CYAN|nr:GAF domain-containing sensor histidine kinase [Halotia branconii]WGV23940.1 GAF domain-containing sensor histidine kinase [Halotia branconii CENA392]
MLSSSDLSFSRNLPLVVFNQLEELLRQMAQAIGNNALILTEAIVARIHIPVELQMQRFTLVVADGFSALLLGNIEQERSPIGRVVGEPETYLALSASLTFNPEAIASFLTKLKDLFRCDSSTYQNLESYRQLIRPNDATLQSQFTLLLLECLLPQSNEQATALPREVNPEVYVCQPVEDALKKQISQERLLNQVTTQIRKSLDLPVILATAIAQVREFLELDRLVIYKFAGSGVNRNQCVANKGLENLSLSEPGKVSLFAATDTQQLAVNGQISPQSPIPEYGGCVVYEALATDAISSVLYYKEKCFGQATRCWEKYRQGFILAIDDVEKAYSLEECLLNFLRESQIRAKLAAPIMFEDKLWGLLIAHQCHDARQWTESEKSLLTSIAEQLAIAIHQSELMGSLRDAARILTEEKETLEQRVIERTTALRDALLAAEAASRLRSEFLATISHELLTPLTYVIGMSSTLLRWPLGELSQRQRDYLQTIHDSGEHLLEMINDILDLSQIEAGKTVLNITEFSLTNIAENTLESLLKKATSEQINLQLDLQIDPQRDRFTADTERVVQILWNLLTNAIKFTPEGGSVTLRLWVEDDTAIFQVEDTGIGIPEEKLPLLFEKFQQLDTPYRRRYEGTGLGLALTKQLIELHRGRIEVESTVGIGSIFTVWIPVQQMRVLSQ